MLVLKLLGIVVLEVDVVRGAMSVLVAQDACSYGGVESLLSLMRCCVDGGVVGVCSTEGEQPWLQTPVHCSPPGLW